jgi:hypothetical protein
MDDHFTVWFYDGFFHIERLEKCFFLLSTEVRTACGTTYGADINYNLKGAKGKLYLKTWYGTTYKRTIEGSIGENADTYSRIILSFFRQQKFYLSFRNLTKEEESVLFTALLQDIKECYPQMCDIGSNRHTCLYIFSAKAFTLTKGVTLLEAHYRVGMGESILVLIFLPRGNMWFCTGFHIESETGKTGLKGKNMFTAMKGWF